MIVTILACIGIVIVLIAISFMLTINCKDYAAVTWLMCLIAGISITINLVQAGYLVW